METFIARQPILDRNLALHGYELLHREEGQTSFCHENAAQATARLLEASLLAGRFEDLTGGRLGFVNLDRAFLLRGLADLLPAERAVIELLETIEPDAQVLEGVRRLREDGFTIALDDYVSRPGDEALVRLADIIKVDFMDTDAEERRGLIERLRRPGLTFLAEKIETREAFQEARELGYELFQGYFFCVPETLKRRGLPSNKVSQLGFLREISRPALDLEEIEELVKADPALSSKLLRYLNTSRFAPRSPIESIGQALVHLGERPLRQWGALIALASLDDEAPVELVRTCLVRAMLCERLAEPMQEPDAAFEFYLVGLFSLIETLVRSPLEVLLAEIGLSSSLGDAIRGDLSTSKGRALAVAQACERGDRPACRQLLVGTGLSLESIAGAHADSIRWVEGVLRAA